MINDKILTAGQMHQSYQELSPDFKYPYFYQISNDKQLLYFLGFYHSNNPENPDFDRLKKLWNEFLLKTEKQNVIVLEEGGKWPVLENEEKAILMGGEAALMAFLADKEGFSFESPEPDDKDELKYLAKDFSLDEIMYQRFARTADQWNRLINKPIGLKEYVEDYLRRDCEIMGWDYDFSLDHMIKMHNQKHNHEFFDADQKCFHQDSAPDTGNSAESSSRFRDNHILEEIKKYWKQGKNIFIVYGSGHAIKLEKALKEELD